nr:ribosome maturation factor RimP [Gammaproteobacteria bacterium]
MIPARRGGVKGWAFRPFFICIECTQVRLQVSSKLEDLQGLLAPVVEALGYECWGIEFLSQGRHSLLRVYIDKPDGILVDDCEVVSRQISGVLDVEDPISSEYTLEVSSPGMDRPLFKLEQFARHAGEQVKIRLRIPFEGRRNFQGLLRGVEEQDVVVLVDDHEYLLPIDSIDKANIVPRFD